MNIKWSLKQIVLAALACTLIGLGGLLFLYRQGAMDQTLVPIELEKELDASAIESFSLKTDTPNMTVISTTGSKIRIRLTGEILKQEAEKAGINIISAKGSEAKAEVRTVNQINIGIDVTQFFHLFNNKLEVTVELPEKQYRSLVFGTDTGDLALPALRADKLELKSDTGDIRLDGFTGTKLTVGTDTGTMRLDHLNAGLSLKSSTGHIVAGLDAIPSPADLQTDTGDIELTLDNPLPARLDFSSDTGRTSISLPSPNAFNGVRMEKHKLEGLLSGGGPTVKARSDTGDIELAVKQ